MKKWVLGVALALTGCGVGVTTPDANPDASPSPTGTPSDAITITEVFPSEGPSGTVVEIRGVGFGDSTTTSVLWGGNFNLTINEITDTMISMVVPASSVGGPIDIEVTHQEHGKVTLPGGYTYRGGYGAVALIEWINYTNPQQWNPTAQDELSTYAAFMLPELDTLAPVVTGSVQAGDCELNPQGSGATVQPLDAGPEVELAYNSIVLTVPKNGSFYEPAGGVSTDLTGFVTNTKYTLRSPAGGTGAESIPAFQVDDAVHTPHDFTLNAPNIAGFPFATATKASNMVFGWTTDYPADMVNIILRGYSLTGAATDGPTGNNLHCASTDTGSFTVTAADLAQLTQANHVIVTVARRSQTETVLYENQESTVQSIGYITKVGVLELQ